MVVAVVAAAAGMVLTIKKTINKTNFSKISNYYLANRYPYFDVNLVIVSVLHNHLHNYSLPAAAVVVAVAALIFDLMRFS